MWNWALGSLPPSLTHMRQQREPSWLSLPPSLPGRHHHLIYAARFREGREETQRERAFRPFELLILGFSFSGTKTFLFLKQEQAVCRHSLEEMVRLTD